MRWFWPYARKLIEWFVVTIIGRGLLIWLASKGIEPEQWVAKAIVQTAEAPKWAFWVLPGLVGLIGVLLLEKYVIPWVTPRRSSAEPAPVDANFDNSRQADMISPIRVADEIFIDFLVVTDEWQIAATDMIAAYVALQVWNGNDNGATLRKVQAHLETGFGDQTPLSFRKGDIHELEIDIRQGKIEFLELGFVITGDDIGVKPRASQIRQPISHAALASAIYECQTNDFCLYVGGNEKRKCGNGVTFRIVITADDTPAFSAVYKLNLDADSPSHWLERVERS